MLPRIYWVDVFTSEVFTGNPLAVILDGEHLESTRMQAIAAELHLAEISFVLQPQDPRCAYGVRIFTTTQEIPLSGHAAIGTAWVAAQAGIVTLQAGSTRILTETRAGILAVEYESDDQGRISHVTMHHPQPSFGDPVEAADLQPLLGLPYGEIERTGLQPQIVKTALQQIMVPVTSPDLISRLKPDMRRLAAMEAHLGTLGIAIFHYDGAGTVHQRVFFPTDKVPEDPASGMAAGAVGAYLAHNGQLTGLPAQLTTHQGREVDRPSQLFVTVYEQDGAIGVKVGGQVVPVMRGDLLV